MQTIDSHIRGGVGGIEEEDVDAEERETCLQNIIFAEQYRVE